MELYDLELEKRTALSTVFAGFNPVFTPALNTVIEDEILNIIEYYGDEPDGVKVLLRHEVTQEMREGPSEPACSGRFQTTLSCSGKGPGW